MLESVRLRPVCSVTYHRHTVFSPKQFFGYVHLPLWNKQHTKICPHLHFSHESAKKVRNSHIDVSTRRYYKMIILYCMLTAN